MSLLNIHYQRVYEIRHNVGTSGVRGVDGSHGVGGSRGVDGSRGADGIRGGGGIRGVDGIRVVDGIRGVGGSQLTRKSVYQLIMSQTSPYGMTSHYIVRGRLTVHTHYNAGY